MPLPSSSHYGLALHTTTPELGLAISDFVDVTRSQVWNLGRDTSNLLHSYLAEFLQPQVWSDLVLIAVAKGPGGFTGTRLGVVTARTLAQQLNIPLFAVSTLAAIAWQTSHQLEQPGAIAVQMPAQRGQLFTAIYQVDQSLTPLLPDAVMTPEQWQQVLDGWRSPLHRITADQPLGNSVNSILDLAYLDWQNKKRPDWSEALPFYGQHPVEK